MTNPVTVGPDLDPPLQRKLRSRLIFDYCKWDPQVGDTETIAPFPVILQRNEWQTIAGLAEGLTRETLAIEAELLGRPDLFETLGLPKAVCRLLGGAGFAGEQASVALARVMRFDFHFTASGWMISEVNSDVPGGFNEACGFGDMLPAFYAGTASPGDPGAALAAAIASGRAGKNAPVALVHATAYTDDRQVMVFLARKLHEKGLATALTAPDGIGWNSRRAFVRSPGAKNGELGGILRFFPAEWLVNMRTDTMWRNFFLPGSTPACNPGQALLVQSKRMPLVFDELDTDTTLWRRLLPETRDPRHPAVSRHGGWVIKPALGRVGEDIGMHGVIPRPKLDKLWKLAHRRHREWIAQRQFDAVPVFRNGNTAVYPCVGVYTVDGKAAGAYGRVSTTPLISANAQDTGVLLTGER